jgi:hypothetical protein
VEAPAFVRVVLEVVRKVPQFVALYLVDHTCLVLELGAVDNFRRARRSRAL